jgi:hypothetical protein
MFLRFVFSLFSRAECVDFFGLFASWWVSAVLEWVHIPTELYVSVMLNRLRGF